MKPEKVFNLIAGVSLLTIGLIALAGNVFFSTNAWRLWPVILVLAGAGLTLPGFLGLMHRGFGAFFIPGVPVLVTGGILLFASMTNYWEIWSVAWTLIVLGLAIGFILAAIFMRAPGLIIPAFIIGVNALMFIFCVVTGWWESWAILWPIEFLGIGLGLLVLGIANRSAGVKTAASVLLTIAGAGFFLTAFLNVFSNNSILRFAVPALLLLTGSLLVMTFFLQKVHEIPPTVEHQ